MKNIIAEPSWLHHRHRTYYPASGSFNIK